MNLRDLHYFLALAETRHFGRAAARTHVSQPTLSGQIRKLEEALGVVLFERTTKSVALTRPGAMLLPYARRAVEEADALVQHARAHRDPLVGPLRIGAIPTLAPYLVPLILEPLRKRYPGLKLVLSEEITSVLTERLLRHELDTALIATPVEYAELETRALFEEPFWVALPRRHPLVHKDPITRRDLESLDMLLLADGHCLAQQAMDICRLADRKDSGDHADLRASSLETVLQLVGAQMGATLVPALALRGAWMTDAGVIARPLKVPDAFRRIQLVWRKSFPRPAAIHALADVITSSLPNTVHPSKPTRSSAPDKHRSESPPT